MRDVLAASASGRSVRETALALHLSVSTVKTIRAAAIARLEARSWDAAIATAVRRGDI
jgi:DNA-binding NarL/FixJ family response regulator